MQTTHKSWSLTILAVLALISGILGVLGSLSILTGSAIMSARGSELPPQVSAYGWALLAIAVLQVAFGYGAWARKRWAWPFGMALQVTAAAFALVDLASGAELVSQLGAMAIAAMSIVLLLTPGVRRACGKVKCHHRGTPFRNAQF